MRKIIHIDMDAFFASIEQRDRPELRGLPVIIGGSPEHRGVVSTCSYEARVFGVHSAMPMRTAVRLCPQGVFLGTDFKKYRAASDAIHDIFYRYTSVVEPVSIDEAYLDVTENQAGEEDPVKLARMILDAIYAETRLTASAGVSYNKFLAKIASDMRKPAGLTVITAEDAVALLDSLPVGKFHGIGKVSARRLHAMNIRTGRDLRQLDAAALTAIFGKLGLYYYHIVRGIDNRPVETDDERKSVGREITLERDCSDGRRLRILLRTLALRVARRLQAYQLQGKTITLKVRYENFETVTRAISLAAPTCDGHLIGETAIRLTAKTQFGSRPVRLIGVTVSNFAEPGEADQQLELPFPP